MGDFKQNRGKRFGGEHGGGFERRGGGRPSFPGKSWGGGDRDRGPVTMHQATCAKCGAPCEVPFRPFEGRPVYCRNCFQSQKGDGDNRNEGRSFQKNYSNDRNFSRPDFRNDYSSNDGLKNQLEALNAKMDRLIRAVEAMTSVKPSLPEEQISVTAEPEPVAVAKVKKAKKDAKKAAKKKAYKRPF